MIQIFILVLYIYIFVDRLWRKEAGGKRGGRYRFIMAEKSIIGRQKRTRTTRARFDFGFSSSCCLVRFLFRI